MSTEHSYTLRDVQVRGLIVTATYDNTLMIDGEHHADFLHTEIYNLAPPVFDGRGDSELLIGGNFPTGTHFHITIGTEEIILDAMQDAAHYEIAQMIVDALPDTITPFITSEPTPDNNDFITVMSFEDAGVAGTSLTLSAITVSGAAVTALPQMVVDALQAVLP